MSRIIPPLVRGRFAVAVVAAALLGAAAGNAEEAVNSAASGSNADIGRIDLKYEGLPPATVEVDLSQGMFTDLFGIGDAAIAGVAEALGKASGANEGTKMAAEQLAAARQIVQITGQVVREVRVRIYQDVSKDEEHWTKMMGQFGEKTHAGSWEQVVKAHDDENMVSVSVARSGGAIRGVFVLATDGDNLVLTNVVCDVSQENAKKLSTAATKAGLEAGMGQMIEAKLRKLHERSQANIAKPAANGPQVKIVAPAVPTSPAAVAAPVQPVAPVPPTPPTPPVKEKAE